MLFIGSERRKHVYIIEDRGAAMWGSDGGFVGICGWDGSNRERQAMERFVDDRRLLHSKNRRK